LRLHIYSYLLPLDLDRWNLLSLVLCCRTIKEETYHEMGKLVKKCAEQLESRWPFDERFNMPFPALAFQTKQLVIQVPHFSNGHSSNLSSEIGKISSARMYKFRQGGAFDVGARLVLLRILPPARVITQAPIPFFRLPPNPLKQPGEQKETSILLRLYRDLTWNGNAQARFPEQLIIAEYGREHPTSADAFPRMSLFMSKGPTDRCLDVRGRAAYPMPNERPVDDRRLAITSRRQREESVPWI
jgi:hypothetical protein